MVYAFKGVAPALDTLLDQLNRLAPKRSKLSDGALGDQAHAARVSFHNPNSAGIVQARDFTDDPAGGLDCKWLAKALTQSGDPRILEIISNRQYWTPKGGWVPYTGSNPHDKHLHLTVRSEPAYYNSTAPWDLSRAGSATPPSEEDDMYGANERNEVLTRLDIATSIASDIRNALNDPRMGALAQLARISAVVGTQRADIDEAELAKNVIAGLVPVVVEAVGKVGGLTVEQVTAATEKAVRAVFADAAA